MKDYIVIGGAPPDEDCVQVSSREPYYEAMKAECRRFKELMEKAFPPVEGSRFGIKTFPHDFGSYSEVVCWYDEDYPDSVEFAYSMECASPGTWEELEELALLAQRGKEAQ